MSTLFRVHLSDGTKHDVTAPTPGEASRAAIGDRKGVVATKIKKVRT